MAEIGGRRARSVAAMIVRVCPVARSVERSREPRIAGAVLGEAVGDLDDRLGPPVRQPAPAQEARPLLGAKLELPCPHRPPFLFALD